MKNESNNINPYQSPTAHSSDCRSFHVARINAGAAFRFIAGGVGFWILNSAYDNFWELTDGRPFAALRKFYPIFGGGLLMWIALFGFVPYPSWSRKKSVRPMERAESLEGRSEISSQDLSADKEAAG